MLELCIRKIKDEDINFILKSWLRTSKMLHPEIEANIFYRDKEIEIKEFLSSELVEFKIYCPKEDPDTILGFVVYTPVKSGNILHFIYVKKDLRRQGFAANMLEAIGDSHIATEKPPRWCDIPYNPMLTRKVII
jgi:GNAT superfamily N-acetyltransferase